MSVSRVVALVTPVFAALAGYVATQAARLPGAPALDSGELTALFVAGAAAATAGAVKWLDGRAKHERQASDEAQERDRWAAYEPEPDRYEGEGEGDDEPTMGPITIEQLSDMQEEINRARQKRRQEIENLRGVVGWHDLEAKLLASHSALSARLDGLESGGANGAGD